MVLLLFPAHASLGLSTRPAAPLLPLAASMAGLNEANRPTAPPAPCDECAALQVPIEETMAEVKVRRGAGGRRTNLALQGAGARRLLGTGYWLLHD